MQIAGQRMTDLKAHRKSGNTEITNGLAAIHDPPSTSCFLDPYLKFPTGLYQVRQLYWLKYAYVVYIMLGKNLHEMEYEMQYIKIAKQMYRKT